MMRHLAESLLELAATPWGIVALVVHAFFGAIILPLAHELFLIPVALAKPQWSFFYALVSTTLSVLGGAVNYGVGRWGGEKVIHKFVKPKLFLLIQKEIHRYDVWAVVIAYFTPIPDKLFALVAGAVHLPLKKMLIIAFLARGARFFLVCMLIYFYGYQIRAWLLDYLNLAMMLFLALMIFAAFSWKLCERYFFRKEHIPE